MKIDRYEVVHREDGAIHCLGHGATSSAYKALDLDLQVPVVLKVVRQEFLEDKEARRRFLHEARAVAVIRHPNVAQIYRLGDEDDVCFYAREFIEGETAETIVKRDGPMAPMRALEVALHVAQALVTVKKMNLVHRDIKPSNIMITAEGAVKIIDFGFARGSSLEATEQLEVIALSGFQGTAEYASPEQLNEEPVGVASDMYSLGVTLWFLLTGRAPFRGPAAQVMVQHLQDAPPFDELPTFGREILSLLAHLLEKDPERRPATPTHLVAEIEGCLALLRPEESLGARIAPPAPPTPLGTLALPKMTAARKPADEVPRRSVLGEALIGTAIAVVVYIILSRPIEPLLVQPPPAAMQSESASFPMESPMAARETVPAPSFR